MKKLIILGAFILTAGLLNAQTQTKKVNQRQKNQTTRIAKGAKSGELTKKETKQLARQQRDIRKTKRNAKADGVVTRKERAVIHQKQNAANRNIKRKKNNSRSRN
ncbi:MAG: hypothetical protein CMP61_08350 [Flavobacteriales bacterium]|nr:hypothetical protein [Flavobacteriales bacterium]|tara:strand:- start:12993 stop:13307 length:315 start_codon:yes stop_codon:yes gene_type:complete